MKAFLRHLANSVFAIILVLIDVLIGLVSLKVFKVPITEGSLALVIAITAFFFIVRRMVSEE